MKKFLVVFLSVILALSGGLLVYGTTLGDEIRSGSADLGELLPPVGIDAYAHDIAEWIANYPAREGEVNSNIATSVVPDPATFAPLVDGWYDVFGQSDPSGNVLVRFSGATLAGKLILPVTYNHIRAKQYCMASHFEVSAGGKDSYSDNLRIRQSLSAAHVDRYYLSCAWTGSPLTSYATLRAGFDRQAFTSKLNTIKKYDADTGYLYNLRDPSEEGRDPLLDPEIPYKTFSLFSLPIYLGDLELDVSVVDGTSVKVVSPTRTKPYYTLTFSEDLATAQRSENTNRMNKALGGRMSDISIKKANFTFEIWECGLFRQITAEILLNAKIGVKQGDAEANMSYKFYYDDENCSIVKRFASVGWEKYLSAENRERFDRAREAA